MSNTRPAHAWLFGLLVMFLTACAVAPVEQARSQFTPVSQADEEDDTMLIIAHRGASGLRPEHTLEAYKLAIEQGADFIEPDLVMTKDGALVARHDPWLSDSTNVADLPQFADRKRTLTSPDGEDITDWWAFDFTVEELKTLRARQVRDNRSKEFDDQFEIPLFDEIVALAKQEGQLHSREIGIYPEAKWPKEHAAEGLNMENAFVDAMAHHGMSEAYSPMLIQCFDPDFLRSIDKRIDTRLIQLVYFDQRRKGMASVDLETAAEFADGVGPAKAMVMNTKTGKPTGYAQKARALGLEVHPWTFRDDALGNWPDAEAEMRAIKAAGATGLFTDFPATAVRLFKDE